MSPWKSDKVELLKSHIDAYVRSNGTQVKAHDDKRVKKTGGDDHDTDGISGDVGLDHPAYNTPVKLGGYNGKTTVHQVNSSRDAANVLIRNNPEWSKTDHAKLAADHQKAADAHHEAWSKRVDQAHQETFGKPFGIGDYKVSGIARDEYSNEHKTALRTHAHSATKHEYLAAAHAAASKSRLVKS